MFSFYSTGGGRVSHLYPHCFCLFVCLFVCFLRSCRTILNSCWTIIVSLVVCWSGKCLNVSSLKTSALTCSDLGRRFVQKSFQFVQKLGVEFIQLQWRISFLVFWSFLKFSFTKSLFYCKVVKQEKINLSIPFFSLLLSFPLSALHTSFLTSILHLSVCLSVCVYICLSVYLQWNTSPCEN